MKIGAKARAGPRRELDEPGTVRKARQQPRGDAEGKTGLAGPSYTGQRRQPHPPCELLNVGDVPLPADQPGHLRRKVVPGRHSRIRRRGGWHPHPLNVGSQGRHIEARPLS